MKKAIAWILLSILLVSLAACGKSEETECASYEDHQWGEPVVAVPGCETAGYSTYSCINCGFSENRDEVQPVGHTWVKGNCMEPDSCSTCGVKLEIINEHNFVYGVCTVCSTAEPGSEGLEYSSNGDGTCSVISIGTCTDTEIKIPTTSPFGETVIAIGSDAFADAPITSVTLPGTLETIGYSAFWGCKIKELNIPDSVTLIDDYAFALCSHLEQVHFGAGVEIIGVSAFSFTKVKEVVLPASLVTLDSSAFHECNYLQSVELSEKLSVLMPDVFARNDSLEHIDVPDSVYILSYRVFEKCESLQSVSLGSGVERIEADAFAGCTALKTIYYNGTEDAWNKIDKVDGWDADLDGCMVVYSEEE